MQIRIFNIPIGAEDGQIEELNHFLRAHKIIDIKRELAVMGGNSCWTFCITYMLGAKTQEPEANKSSAKVDYKQMLEPEVFERFSELRKLRKQVAEKEAVPAYAVFTDAELAELAKYNPLTPQAMAKVVGVGRKKIERYGKAFCTPDHVNMNEEDRIPEGADNGFEQPV